MKAEPHAPTRCQNLKSPAVTIVQACPHMSNPYNRWLVSLVNVFKLRGWAGMVTLESLLVSFEPILQVFFEFDRNIASLN